MQAYQPFNEMDSIMSQERKYTRPLSLPAVPFKSNDLPRFFQEVPLAMNSPLSSDTFAVWPPTPRNIGERHPVSEAPYPFSMPEDGCSSGATSAWGGSVHGTPEQPTVSAGMEVPQTYGSPIESKGTLAASPYVGGYSQRWSTGNEWDRPRSGDYSSMLNDDHTLGSSYGSNQETGLLGPEGYITRSPAHSEILSLDTTNLPRRLSYSETADNMPSAYNYGDSTASTSYDGSYLTDYTHTPLSLPSSLNTPLSPVMSVRSSASRGRGSPSPSRALRFDPYDKSKRWSTGNYINSNVDSNLLQLHTPIHTPQSLHSSPTCGSVLPYHQHIPQQAQYPPPVNAYSPYVDNHPHQHHPLMSNFCIPSHGPSETSAHYDACAEPPNLYASLLEDQIPPPPEDMNTDDPELKPHEQDLRFEGDLYTPRWVRGHGNKREGWCGICKPGRWLVLKNSAFWYDKSFTHGISAATGQSFNEPRDMRRMDGNPDVWEGLCHSCTEWVPLVSNKKKGTTWFRHAYKCHTHNKIKDAPKRRRESHAKAAAFKSELANVKPEY